MNNLVIELVWMEREECERDWELRHLSWNIEIVGSRLHLPSEQCYCVNREYAEIRHFDFHKEKDTSLYISHGLLCF